MKKAFVLLLALLALCTIAMHETMAVTETYLSDAPAPTQTSGGIVLEPCEPILFIGETIQLKASGAESILWSSSDPAVATVDEKGVVTAVAAGEVTITACSAQDSNIRADATFMVGVHTEAVKLEETELVLVAGTSDKADYDLIPQILPEDALVKEVTYASSNAAILTVDENGHLHAVAPGNVTVTVTSADKGCKAPAKLKVTVKQAVTGIELNKTEAELYLKEKLNLTAKVLPQNATNKKCVWSSSNEAVATVSPNGAVTATGEGKAVIRCAAEDNGEVFAECTVNVTIPVQKIVLDPANATLLLGGPQALTTAQLKYTLTPENASFQNVTWTSSDEKIATVDVNGQVRGISIGKATITATTTDPRAAGKVKAVCTITVGNAVTGINLEGGDNRIQKGKSARFTAKIKPEKPFNGKLVWSSSNENIIKVDANGNVRAINVGSATVTVKTTDGSNISASKNITVYQPVTQLSAVEKGTIVVFAGQSKTLHVTVGPNDATDKRVRWESSNAGGLRVDSSGTISAHSAGTYTITATATDGSKKSCKYNIIVEPKVPISLESLGFGIYNANLLGITVKNKCARTTIKNFDFKIVLYTYDGSMLNTSGIYNLGKDATISPNATKTIKRSMSGVSWAQKITITIVGVTLSDGTYYSIPSSAQETWTFRR